MKSRYGFVSNSSSASFVIKISDMTEEQQKMFSLNKLPKAILDKFPEEYRDIEEVQKYLNGWNIEEINGHMCGGTVMDNANLNELLDDKLRIPGSYDECFSAQGAYSWAKKKGKIK